MNQLTMQYNTDTVENRRRVKEWVLQYMPRYCYDSAFDMAVDCAYDLGLCEYCEINGDNTFIPVYIVEIARIFIPEGVSCRSV